VTDGLGEMELSVGISALAESDDPEELKVFSWKEIFVDPLKEKWLLVRFKDFCFPKPGTYLFDLTVAGEHIAQSILEIQEV
jgi:hypothetical protein